MNLLIDQILSGKFNINKIKKLTKEDQRVILSTILSKFKEEKNKKDKIKFAVIVTEIKKMI